MEGRGAATVLALTAAALGSSLHAASHGRRDDPEGRAAWMRQACAQARLSVPVESAYCVGCVLVKHGKVWRAPCLGDQAWYPPSDVH
jgi:hypothetical protein